MRQTPVPIQTRRPKNAMSPQAGSGIMRKRRNSPPTITAGWIPFVQSPLPVGSAPHRRQEVCSVGLREPQEQCQA